MTWPTVDVNTTNVDADGDSPLSARPDVLDLIQKFNQLRAHVSTQGQQLLDDTTFAAMRASLGIYSGNVSAAGTALSLPSGWSSILVIAGEYEVTHNLGVDAYDVTISARDNVGSGVITQIATAAVNSFGVLVRLANDTVVNSEFNFILIKR